MPYIELDQRPLIDQALEPALKLIRQGACSQGDMNYMLTRIAIAQLGSTRYFEFEALLGRLEAVKLEWWRRTMVPYEDRKRAVNGDVFPFPPDYTAPGPFADPVLVPAQVPGQVRTLTRGDGDPTLGDS